MQKTFNFFYAFLLTILGFGATLMAEDITLTTYYPAPYGAYEELTTTGNTYLATDSGSVGIGTTTPPPSTKLDVYSNNSGPYTAIYGSKIGSGTPLYGVSGFINGGSAGFVQEAVRGYANITAGEARGVAGYSEGASVGTNIGVYGRASGAATKNWAGYFFGDVYLSDKVGIGTTSPNYKLDVSGDINTTGDVRKNGSAYINPDYVFEPGYALMPMSELRSYVLENKHLPKMPSTKEIKQDGVKLFEQNRLLLEKIEEAYLHIFKLEERISKLESVINKER